VVVAVAAVTSVAFLSDRVGRALERDALQMLGADLVIEADAALPDKMLEQAKSNGLNVVRTFQFPSMVGAGEKVQLASVKAVEHGYPLRGALLTTTKVGADSQSTNIAPEVGQVWVDPQILAQTDLGIGGQLKVGDLQLQIARVISYEPDRGPQFVNLAPRVMMRAEDLARSGLLGPGSRVGYALLVAGDAAAIEKFKTWISTRLSAGQKIVSVESGRPEIRRSLDRAQQFLSLVAMLAVLIAAVAVALGARRFSQRHRQSVAVMRCLGATQRKVTMILLGEFVWGGCTRFCCWNADRLGGPVPDDPWSQRFIRSGLAASRRHARAARIVRGRLAIVSVCLASFTSIAHSTTIADFQIHAYSVSFAKLVGECAGDCGIRDTDVVDCA